MHTQEPVQKFTRNSAAVTGRLRTGLETVDAQVAVSFLERPHAALWRSRRGMAWHPASKLGADEGPQGILCGVAQRIIRVRRSRT